MPCTTSLSSSLPAVCTGRVIVFEHAQYASQYLVGEVTHTSSTTTTTSGEASLLTVHACLTCSPVTSAASTTTDTHNDSTMKVGQPLLQDIMGEEKADVERHKTPDAGVEDTSNVDRQFDNSNKADVPRIVLRCRRLRGIQASTSSAVQPVQDDLHELHSRRTSLLHDMATSQARMAQIHATLTKLRTIPSQQPVQSETDIHTGTESVVHGSDAHIAHETSFHHVTGSSSCAMQEPGQLDSAVMTNAAAVNEPVRPASMSCETLSSVTAASPVTTTTTAGRVNMRMSALAEADTSVTTMSIAVAVNTAKAQLHQARAALHSVPACDWADLRRQFHPSPALQSLIETVLLVLSLSRGESGTQVQYGRIWQLKDLPQRLQHVSAKTLRHRTTHTNTHIATTTTTSTSRTSGCSGVHALRIADVVRDCVQAERTRRALHDHATARPLYQWLCALLAVYMADEEEREEREQHAGEYSMRTESVASQSGMSDLCASSLRSATYRSSLRRSTKEDKKNEGSVCHDHNNNNSDTSLTHVVEAAPRVASRSPSAVAPDSQPIATHHNLAESNDHTLRGEGGVEGVVQQQQEEERQDMMSCARLEKELREHGDYVALAEEELHELDELIAQLTQALTDTPSPATHTTTTTQSSAEDATHATCHSSSSGDMPCATGDTTKDAASSSSTNVVVGVVLQIDPRQVCGVLSDTAGRALMRYVTTTTTISLVEQQQSAKDSEFIVPQHTYGRSSSDRRDDDVAAAFDELTAIVARHIRSAAASENNVQPDSHYGEYADKADTQHKTTTTGEAAAVRDVMAGETHTLTAVTTHADSTATAAEEKVEEEVQRTTTTATAAVALSLPSAPPIRFSTGATVTNNNTTTTTSPLPSALRGVITHTEGHTAGHHRHIRKSNSQGTVPASYSSCSRPASRPGSRASSQHSHSRQQRSSEKIKIKADTPSHSRKESSHDKSHSLVKASEERTMRLLLQEELHASHAELRRLRAERDKLRAQLHRRRHYYNNTSTSPTAASEGNVVSDAVVACGKGSHRRQKRQQNNNEAVGVTSVTPNTVNNAQKEETAGAVVSSETGQRAAKDNTEHNKAHSSASSSSSSDNDDDSALERLQAELKAANARIAQLEQQQKMKEVAAKDKANGTVTGAAASADATTTTTMIGKGSIGVANNTIPSAGVGQVLLYSPAEALAAQQRLTEQVSALQAVVQQHERRAHSLEVDLNAALHRCTAAEQTIQRQRRELATVWAQLGSSSSNNHITSQSGQPPTTTTTTTDIQLPSTSLVNDADAAQASSPTSLLLPQHTTSSSATIPVAERPCAQQSLTASPAAHNAHEDHTAPSTHTNAVVPPPSRLDTSSLSSIAQSEDMSIMTGATQMTLGTTTTATTTAIDTRHRPAMLHSTRPATTTTSNNNKDYTVTSAAMASSLVSSFATITTTHNNNNNSNGVSYRHDCFALPPTGPAVEPMTPLELRHEVYRLRQELERYYVEGLRYKTALQTLRERQHEERRRRSEMRVVRYSVLQNLQESINNIVQKQDQDMRQVAQLLEHSREELSMSTPSHMGST